MGGGYADIPLIQAAKALGFYVITCGADTQGLGHKFADEVYFEDYSDQNRMFLTAQSLHIDAICAGCNDFAALSAAYVAQKLNLPGHDTPEISRLLHHKDSYRKFAAVLGIPTPKARGLASISEALSVIKDIKFPFLVKPVDLSGGKGISKVSNASDAIKAIESALTVSKAKRVVIEEFIEGTRHGFSAFLRAGQLVFYFVDDEHYHLSPYLVSGASVPTSCSASTVRRVIEHSQKIASNLRLVDGIFHVQFIERRPDDPVIIEICRRAPGDLYVDLVRHATGAPYAEWIVRSSAGLDISDIRHLKINRFVTRHCLMADEVGLFDGFNFDSVVGELILDQLIWAKRGDVVRDPSIHKFGIVFLEYGDIDKLRKISKNLRNLLSIKLK